MLTGGTETLLRVLALMGHTLQAASLLPSSIRGAGDCVPRAQEGLPFFLHLTSAALLQSRPARDAHGRHIEERDAALYTHSFYPH